jgi:hypothetical protein
MEEKIVIEIIAKHGSDFQKDLAMYSLVGILKGYQDFRINRHKKNFCQIKINNINVQDIDLNNYDSYGKTN